MAVLFVLVSFLAGKHPSCTYRIPEKLVSMTYLDSWNCEDVDFTSGIDLKSFLYTSIRTSCSVDESIIQTVLKAKRGVLENRIHYLLSMPSEFTNTRD